MMISAVHRRLVEREWGLARGNWPSLRSDIVQWAEGVTSDLRATGTEATLRPPLRKAIAWHVYVAARAKEMTSILFAICLLWLPWFAWAVTSHPHAGEIYGAPVALLPMLYAPLILWRFGVVRWAKGRCLPLALTLPVIHALGTIAECARLVAVPAKLMPVTLQAVSESLRATERAVLRARRRCRLIPRSSPRRGHIDRHARLVVAALRRAELRLDAETAEGARELSRLLILVAEGYASARLGSLLPEDELKDLEPVRDRTALWETLHVMAALAVIGAVGWTGTWYGEQIGVEAPWSLIPAAIAAVLVFPRLRTSGPDLLMSYLGP